MNNEKRILRENRGVSRALHIGPCGSPLSIKCRNMTLDSLRYRLHSDQSDRLAVLVLHGAGDDEAVTVLPPAHHDERMLGTVIAASAWPAPVIDIAMAWISPDPKFPGGRQRISRAVILKGRSADRVKRLLDRIYAEEMDTHRPRLATGKSRERWMARRANMDDALYVFTG